MIFMEKADVRFSEIKRRKQDAKFDSTDRFLIAIVEVYLYDDLKLSPTGLGHLVWWPHHHYNNKKQTK